MKKLMMGNEAVAAGAADAGVRVVSAYPGTPSTEITEYIAKNEEAVYCEWAPNEKVAVEVAVGACIGGGRAMSVMKHVGLNVAADPLFTAAYTGVNAGMVIVVADDPGMHSSQNEQDSRFYARSAHVPMLEPSDSAEAYEFTRAAFALSEEYDTPVLVRMTTRIAHSRSVVERREKEDIALRPYEKNAAKYVMMPAYARGRHVAVEERERRLTAEAQQLSLNREEMRDTALGVVCSGCVYQYVREALPNASIFKVGMVYPLPTQSIRDFAAKVDKLVVIEELEPFFQRQLEAAGIKVSGKELTGLQGELDANRIRAAFGDGRVDVPFAAADIPARPPVLCPGCPHRGVFYVLNKLGLTVTGDIGCYTLGAVAPLNSIDACVCMGASVGMAHGMEMARGRESAERTVAVIGDSTFIHSGITGLINTVYNGGTSTVILMDNSITGMTGHQQNPATGKNIRLKDAPQLDLEALVRAIGVEHVRVVDPFDTPALEQAVREETARRAPSVIITKRPCELLIKTEKHSLVINDKCRRCGKCLKLGCPAIEKTADGMRINSTLCVACGLCAPVCPFGAIGGEEA